MSRHLAILGGSPSFDQDLHVGRPNIGDRDLLVNLVEDMLDRRWFSNDGPYVREFEARVAEFLGVAHCVAISNGTVALQIAIQATGMHGEVIVPAWTFVATAHALQWQGVTPVFCDVDSETQTLDPGQVSRLITERTTGIIGVHLWGRPCDTDALRDLAEENNLALVYDAAHSFACWRDDVALGGFGNAEVLSFHATKFFNTFEGGAIVTNDDVLAERVRLMRNFGFEGYDKVVHLGINGKMPEVCAAMGLAGFGSIGAFIETNRANYEVYRSKLGGLAGVTLLRPDQYGRSNFQYVVVRIDPEDAGLSRDEVMTALWAERVRARRYFYPGVHRMEPYRSACSVADDRLPVTDRLAEQVLVLPTGVAVRPPDAEMVSDIIISALEQAPAVREACGVTAPSSRVR